MCVWTVVLYPSHPSLLFLPSPLFISSPISRALWNRDEGRVMMWQLDPTEGPGRVRRRMMRAPHTVNERHLLPNARTEAGHDGVCVYVWVCGCVGVCSKILAAQHF